MSYYAYFKIKLLPSLIFKYFYPLLKKLFCSLASILGCFLLDFLSLHKKSEY